MRRATPCTAVCAGTSSPVRPLHRRRYPVCRHGVDPVPGCQVSTMQRAAETAAVSVTAVEGSKDRPCLVYGLQANQAVALRYGRYAAGCVDRSLVCTGAIRRCAEAVFCGGSGLQAASQPAARSSPRWSCARCSRASLRRPLAPKEPLRAGAAPRSRIFRNVRSWKVPIHGAVILQHVPARGTWPR